MVWGREKGHHVDGDTLASIICNMPSYNMHSVIGLHRIGDLLGGNLARVGRSFDRK